MDVKNLVETIKKNAPELLKITCFKCGEKRPFNNYKFEKAEGNGIFFEWICEPCLGSLDPVLRNLVKMQTIALYDNENNEWEDYEFNIDKESRQPGWKCTHINKQSSATRKGVKVFLCPCCCSYCGYDNSE